MGIDVQQQALDMQAKQQELKIHAFTTHTRHSLTPFRKILISWIYPRYEYYRGGRGSRPRSIGGHPSKPLTSPHTPDNLKASHPAWSPASRGFCIRRFA